MDEEEVLFKPVHKDANQVHLEDLADELSRYELMASGVASFNITMLQRAYDEEYEAQVESYRKACDRRTLRQAHCNRQAQLSDIIKAETDILQKYPVYEKWYNLMINDETPSRVRILSKNSDDSSSQCLFAILRALTKNESVLHLDLSRNNYSQNALALASSFDSMLRINNALQTLVLDSTCIGPTVAIAIGNALENNFTLKTLNLGNNSLCPRDSKTGLAEVLGIRAIAKMLKANTTLTSLNLYNTGIDEDIGKVLLAGISSSSSLVALEIGQNDIRFAQVEAITTAVFANQARKKERQDLKAAREARMRAASATEHQLQEERDERESVKAWHDENARLRAVTYAREAEERKSAREDAEVQRNAEIQQLEKNRLRKLAEIEARRKRRAAKLKKKQLLY